MLRAISWYISRAAALNNEGVGAFFWDIGVPKYLENVQRDFDETHTVCRCCSEKLTHEVSSQSLTPILRKWGENDFWWNILRPISRKL